LAREPSDAGLWKTLTEMDPSAAEDVRARLNGVPVQSVQSAALEAPLVVVPPSPSNGSPQEQPPAPKRTSVSGLASFTKRKALDLFTSGEFEAASRQLER